MQEKQIASLFTKFENSFESVSRQLIMQEKQPANVFTKSENTWTCYKFLFVALEIRMEESTRRKNKRKESKEKRKDSAMMSLFLLLPFSFLFLYFSFPRLVDSAENARVTSCSSTTYFYLFTFHKLVRRTDSCEG